MCIQTKIQQKLQQKAELDAQIAKLEQLEIKTSPVKTLLAELLADYAHEAPEDLAAIWQEVLAIGQKFNLSVQPLAVEELQQWEATNAENEKLKQQLEEAHAEITEQDRAWGELSDEKDDLEAELEQLKSDFEAYTQNLLPNLHSSYSEVWQKEDIAPELEKLYQEAQAENTDATVESIPALTLWQPWASLIERKIKCIETRSWATSYRGPLAIHAAKRDINPGDFTHLRNLLPDEDIWTPKGNCEFPLGVVVAIANLVDCVEMTPEFIAQQSEQELKCGNWKPGRFAWILEIIRPVVPPVQVSGGQKLWNWSGTSIAAELEYLEKLKTAPEYEPEEATSTVESVLKAKGFFEPDYLEDYDSSEKYETYRGWDVYYSFPNGGIVSIGLYNVEYNRAWDASTEYIQEVDPTFPESLADYYEIVAWTRALINQVENLEAPGQLALKFPEPEPETVAKCAEQVLSERLAAQKESEPIAAEADSVEPANTETNLEFETMGFQVRVYPQYGNGVLAAATFRFLNSEHTLVFDKSLLVAEIGDRPYKTIAWDLIQDYKDKEAARLERLANPHKKPEDDFIELVKLTPAVGYLKRKDNGELLAVYIAFANRDAAGNKTETMAKPRAKKWHEHLQSPAFERCEWKVEEPRKVKRMTAQPGDCQQFAYEIKIAGKISIQQIQKLAENDFSLLPEEIGKSRPIPAPLPVQASGEIYRVKVNSYEAASGTESEMRSRFDEEIKILGGSQMSVSLLIGSEVVEQYAINDFQFTQVEDFDYDNPEYEVVHLPSQKTCKVWKPLATQEILPGWTNNNIYSHSHRFTKREAAAADAVRRLLKAESAE